MYLLGVEVVLLRRVQSIPMLETYAVGRLALPRVQNVNSQSFQIDDLGGHFGSLVAEHKNGRPHVLQVDSGLVFMVDLLCFSLDPRDHGLELRLVVVGLPDV